MKCICGIGRMLYLLPTVHSCSESSVSACNGFEVKLVCCLNRYIKLSFCGTGGTTVDVSAELTVGGSVDILRILSNKLKA